MATQLISLGLLGISGYAVFKRSQKVSKNIDSKPLHPDQEKNARKYVQQVTQSNINVLGGDLYNAMQVTNWSTLGTSKLDTQIKFASGYQGITYNQLSAMNGLQVMQLANKARQMPTDSKVLFDLDTKKVQNTISSTDIAKITALLNA